MRKIFVYLFVIISAAFILRVYNVANNPPALTWDEVSIGYNAYSILKTGRDEHGRFLPYDTFIAYGDYKPPLAVYLTVPSVALFGLNEFSVRLPSVIFGTGVVLLTYFIVLELFPTYRRKYLLALLGALSVAFSPWAVNLSRAGFEANIGLCLIMLGMYAVLVARRKSSLWIIAWLPLVAAVYTFNSSRYLAPFIGIGMLIYCRKEAVKYTRHTAAGIFIALLALLPIMPHLFSKEARLRFTEVNIFSDITVVKKANADIAYDGTSPLSEILHNRRIGYARDFFMHYFDNLSPDFLFIKGDGNPKFSTQDVGELYVIDGIFLIAGAFFMFGLYRAEFSLLCYWLLVAIIPAAVARETPHALRILNAMPVFHIFIGMGLAGVISALKSVKKRIAVIGVVIIYIICISYYLHGYYVHYPRLYANEWQYGYKQALSYVESHADSYAHVYLTESIGRAYMYTLFYTKYDPDRFRTEKRSYFDAAGFYHVDGFEKYTFTGIPPAQGIPGSLYVFPPGQKPVDAMDVDQVRYPDGTVALELYKI